MAPSSQKPAEKLAQSLERLEALQKRELGNVIRTQDLSRLDRERLQQAGFIQEIIRGWYIPSRLDEIQGDSTAWYASFWHFCAAYFNERFGDDWCLSPEQSLAIHAGNWSVPKQLLVRSPKAANKITALPHGTSFLDVRAQMPLASSLEIKDGLRLFSLTASLIASPPAVFVNQATDMRVALSMVSESSGLLAGLLEGGHTTIAGRLAGAFRNMGQERLATDLLKTMKAAGYTVREQDPFEQALLTNLIVREASPHATRLRLLWQSMRNDVIRYFPEAPGLPVDKRQYVKQVEDGYVTDAYHSLSIEGYRVTPEIIEKVRQGDWNPDASDREREHRNAWAARGYWLAYQAVRKSIDKVLQGQNAGDIADQDHGDWYRELFAPSVLAGLLKPADLAGYRNMPVYIRLSMHVPMKPEAVRDSLPVLFSLLREETHPGVRAVLGHFLFVYIHPYMDGNGRIGRFLMNVMLASGGYPWTVIPVEQRQAYMLALEQASVEHNIVPFTQFLAALLKPNPQKTKA